MPRHGTGRLVLRTVCVLLVAGVAGDRALGMQAASADVTLAPAADRALHEPEAPYQYVELPLPAHFLTPEAIRFDNMPVDNLVTDDGARLGRVLFYDTRLSANGTVSCGSCHVQARAFSDPRRFSRGFDGGLTDRHAMNLVNLRYHPRARFFWDERAGNLEEMVLLPIENGLEMGQSLARLPEVLERDSRYPALFEQAFGDPGITPPRIGMALAQFLRSMVSYQSRYDAGRAAVSSRDDDFPNFTHEENFGKALFLRNCALCHLPDQDAHFVMTATANTGLDDDTRTTDGGVGDVLLDPAGLGHFKSPGLRNVEVTAPYMHDGRFATLDEVLEHYSSGGRAHPNKDVRVQPLHLTSSEKAALVAFLETLTDPTFLEDPRFSDPFEGGASRAGE